MEPIHRLSMNTSLKNARIFDDNAWDEDDCPKIMKEIKKEPNDFEKDAHTQVHSLKLSKVKTEVKTEDEQEDDEFEEAEQDDNFEEAENSNSFCNKSIKQEVGTITAPLPPKITFQDLNHQKIKVKSTLSPPVPLKRSSHDRTVEEGELEDSICERQHPKLECISNSSFSSSEEEFEKVSENVKNKCKTPPTPTIKLNFESVDGMFDESPYNKEVFRSMKIKEQTPVKMEDEELNTGNSRRMLKSAKRTVFTRQSPYKIPENDNYEKRISAKSRLGPKVDEEDEDCMPRNRKQSKQDLESDPAVIARREKQIEYGKNTIGYENYIKMVPKLERKPEDPQTPPRHIKYSRRGWEGLIKQWRIKLHRFDPADPESTEMETTTKYLESDPVVIARRESQIEHVKNTTEYENYIKMVPKSQRKPDYPQTPSRYGNYSTTRWECLIEQWRIKLHRFGSTDVDAGTS